MKPDGLIYPYPAGYLGAVCQHCSVGARHRVVSF